MNGLATSAYNDPNFVTLFLRTTTGGGAAYSIGSGIALAGLGLGLVDDYDVPIHELGHALGLWHTFRGNGESGPADRVAVIYDCIVEEADNAIFYGPAYRGTLSTTVLGRYYISRGIFRNNRVALNLINPGAQPPVNDIGFDRVILTDFFNNGFLPSNVVAADFVKLANARNVAFTGCTFTQPARPSDTPGNLASAGFGHGIIADRTTIRVESYCPSGYPDDPCTHPDYQPAAFTNCTVGLRLTNSLGSRISGAQVTGARKALLAVGSHSLVVTENTFTVDNNETGGTTVGFLMCGGLTFSGNTIQHTAPVTNTTGLYIDDSGTVPTTVDNNLFDDCKNGVIINGQNSDLVVLEAGLQLLCNDMDYSVPPSGGGVKNFTLMPASTVARFQGSEAIPAGNAFTNYATPVGSDFTNSAALSIDYYYSTVAGLPNQEPINTLGNIGKIGLSLNPECTIAFNDFAPDPDPDDVVVHILAEKAKLDLTLNEYEQLGSPTSNQTRRVVEQLNAVHRQLNWSINHLVQDSLHDNSTRIATLLDAEDSALAALAKQTLSLSRVDSTGYEAERIQVAKTGQWTITRNLQEYDQWGAQMLDVFADDRNLFQYTGTELADVVQTAESATDDYARGVAGSFLYLYYDSLVAPVVPLGAYTAPVRPAAGIAPSEPVLIYPNPAAGRFTVELGDGFFDDDRAEEIVTISLRDLTGRLVFAAEQTVLRQSFDLSRSLTSGVYFLSIDNQRTGDRITRRLMLTQ